MKSPIMKTEGWVRKIMLRISPRVFLKTTTRATNSYSISTQNEKFLTIGPSVSDQSLTHQTSRAFINSGASARKARQRSTMGKNNW